MLTPSDWVGSSARAEYTYCNSLCLCHVTIDDGNSGLNRWADKDDNVLGLASREALHERGQGPLNAVFLVNPRTIPFNGLRICLELGPSVDVVCFGPASKVRRGDTDLWIMPNPFHLTSTVISVHVDDAVLS